MFDTVDVTINEELQQVINQASISQKDKGLWLDALRNASPEIAISILSYFEEFPDKISWATDLFKRKIDASKKKDAKTWNKILTEEEEELAQIANEY